MPTIVYDHDIYDVDMKSIPFLRAQTVLNEDKLEYFFNSFLSNYKFITKTIDDDLRNCTNIDTKFYNTYGRSRNLYIGIDNENLDTLNIGLEFDMWFVAGTDLLTAIPEVKAYIKELVETMNDQGTSYLYISNLMRKVEIKFAYVDHIRFVSINRYDSTYQSIVSKVDDISELSVEERRFFVPELLICDLDDIKINDYYVQ